MSRDHRQRVRRCSGTESERHPVTDPSTPRKKTPCVVNADVRSAPLEQALKILATLPGAGTLDAQSPVPGVRRVYLRRVAVTSSSPLALESTGWPGYDKAIKSDGACTP